MDTLTIVAIANFIAIIALVVIVLTRRTSGPSQDISKDLQIHRDELRSSINSNHELIQQSLETIRTATSLAAQGQREEASSSRTELQKTLSDALRNIETKITELTDSLSLIHI